MIQPSTLARRLATDMVRILSRVDITEQEPEVRRIVGGLKGNLLDMKLDVRDHELAETRTEQLQHGRAGVKRLELIRAGMLAASGYGLVSSVEVAELTARLDRLIDELK